MVDRTQGETRGGFLNPGSLFQLIHPWTVSGERERQTERERDRESKTEREDKSGESR